MSELKDNIIALREQGKTYTEIQAELGCSKGTIAYYLGPGQKQKTLDRRKASGKKIRNYIQKIKQETACSDCGENYPYYIMDFDHLEDKSFNISQFVRDKGTNLALLQTELDKCEVVCSNCHRTRTFVRRANENGSKDMIDIHEYYE
jgi:predicted transcriptional regulator